MWYDYQWIVITGGISSFITSYFIGANDVANSFGPSVGAKTLTIAQACILAAFLEFGGAVILGGDVSDTISSGIAKINSFQDNPEFFAYGMLCSLISSSLWLYIATYNGIPVSTTHSIVGAIIGFSMVYGGDKSIVWVESKDSFPYIKGVVPIIISWFTSPFISGVLSCIIFIVNKKLIIERDDNTYYFYLYSPFLLFLTFYINIFFIFFKGGKKELKWDAEYCAWVSSLVAFGCVIISGIGHKIHLKCLNNKYTNNNQDLDYPEIENNKKSIYNKIYDIITYGIHQDIYNDLSQQDKNLHMNITEFDEKIENLYKYLQIFSSSCVAFAHGANDVANAIGPFIGILYVYEHTTIVGKSYAPKWVFIMGGAGIVIGLFTYGYKIIKTIGVKICKMTPIRGYSIELATSLTVLIASISGIPISTTHCVVGAEIGLCLIENRHNMNWRLIGKTFIMWILTIFATGTISALLFSQGIYSPSIQMSRDIQIYETDIKNVIMNFSYIDKNISNDIKTLYNKSISSYIEPYNITHYLYNYCSYK